MTYKSFATMFISRSIHFPPGFTTGAYFSFAIINGIFCQRFQKVVAFWILDYADLKVVTLLKLSCCTYNSQTHMIIICIISTWILFAIFVQSALSKNLCAYSSCSHAWCFQGIQVTPDLINCFNYFQKTSNHIKASVTLLSRILTAKWLLVCLWCRNM